MGDELGYVNPEQRARRDIDAQLVACGWVVQDYKHAAVAAAQGVAVREVPTAAGPADYGPGRWPRLGICGLRLSQVPVGTLVF